MNKLMLLAVAIFFMAACNNNKQDKQPGQDMNHDSMRHDNMQMDSMKHTNHDTMPMDSMKNMDHTSMSSMNHSHSNGSMAGMASEMVMDKANPGDIDPAVKKFIGTLIDQYFSIKNGLAVDSFSAATAGAIQLNKSIKNFDKSFFTARQKKEFDKYVDDTKEQLKAIVSSNTLESQRASFSLLSQDIYGFIKAFGAGRLIYRDNCPMALNNKGASWLSEVKEIRNPYLGSNMQTCGTLQETLQ